MAIRWGPPGPASWQRCWPASRPPTASSACKSCASATACPQPRSWSACSRFAPESRDGERIGGGRWICSDLPGGRTLPARGRLRGRRHRPSRREVDRSRKRVVVSREDAETENLREELQEHARAKLASFKHPKHIFFVDDLPRNAAGKVLKRKLREKFGAESQMFEKVPRKLRFQMLL